jgi:putative toxin-antitoxin system antitoxin component (TIGR02293 family)
MMPMESLTKLLGGRTVLGTTLKNEDDLVELVREGLPYASLERVADGLQMTLDEAADSLRLPRRSLSRRKETGARLNPQESERTVRLARLAVRAEEVLGDMEKAYRWLRKPNRALGGKAPLSMLDVDVGAQQVEHVLGRIQYGVYS